MPKNRVGKEVPWGDSMKPWVDHARELGNLPGDWDGYIFDQSDGIVSITGAIAPLYKIGPKAGTRNWSKKADVSTIRFTHQAHEEWLKSKEKKTGVCMRCQGYKIIYSMSKGWGIECPNCKGVGTVEETNA